MSLRALKTRCKACFFYSDTEGYCVKEKHPLRTGAACSCRGGGCHRCVDGEDVSCVFSLGWVDADVLVFLR